MPTHPLAAGPRLARVRLPRRPLVCSSPSPGCPPPRVRTTGPRRATSPATASTSASPRPSARWTRGCAPRRSGRSASTSPASRAACRNQPNQTPAWVRPSSPTGGGCCRSPSGPQASCNPRFPRYNDDVTINPSSARNYRAARLQGRAEAADAVDAAQRAGHRRGQHALVRHGGLRHRQHRLPRVGAVVHVRLDAQAARARLRLRRLLQRRLGHQALDNARVNRPGAFTLPDRIWIARWDGDANTSTTLHPLRRLAARAAG